MATDQIEVYNAQVLETAANTIKGADVEVPNSEGAIGVALIHADLDVEEPDLVASTWTRTRAAVKRGAGDPTSPVMSQSDVVDAREKRIYSDATPVPCVVDNVGEKPMTRPIDIKANQQNKFYVNVSVMGANNTTTKHCNYHLRFLVRR